PLLPRRRREQPTCHESRVFRPAPHARVARACDIARARASRMRSLPEGAGEEPVDRGPAVLLEEARARAAEVRFGDERVAGRFPHVALPELGAREDADAAAAGVVVALEGEVDLVDAVALGGGAEGSLGAVGGAAEEDAALGKHGRRP